MNTFWKWVSRAMLTSLVLVGAKYATLFTMIAVVVYWLERLYDWAVPKYTEGYALGVAIAKGEVEHADLEDAFNIDLDYRGVGAGTALCETALLSGVLQKGK